MLTLYRARFSTNVERVALALAHKGLAAESVWIDYADRAPVIAISGQGLVPVLVDGSEVVSDSARILEHLERRFRESPLYPTDAARRAELELFIDWFNRIWKVEPNLIADELGSERPDMVRVDELAAPMQARLTLFAAMLSGRDFLFGETVSAADFVAFPFLKYALMARDPEDGDRFHEVLERWQVLGEGHERLARWIRRMDALPRA